MAPDDAAAAAAAEAHDEQSGKKSPGTWTFPETIHLIDAYQDKWYALKRGQLRTSHWNEVADSLAARCAGIPEATDKTSMQCRHKLEKLRRRYRAERQLFLRKASSRSSSSWPYFQRMDLLERGPAEAAADAKEVLLLRDLKPGNIREMEDHDSAMSEDEDLGDSDPPPPPRVFSNRKRRHHYPNPRQEPLYDEDDGFYSPFSKKRGAHEMLSATALNKRDEHKNLKKFPEKMGSSGLRRVAEPPPPVELVSVIRSLGEGFLRMEQMKLQVQRETEQFRAEMQMRRTEMVIDSQKQIADLFAKALVNSRKNKESQASHNQAGGLYDECGKWYSFFFDGKVVCLSAFHHMTGGPFDLWFGGSYRHLYNEVEKLEYLWSESDVNFEECRVSVQTFNQALLVNIAQTAQKIQE